MAEVVGGLLEFQLVHKRTNKETKNTMADNPCAFPEKRIAVGGVSAAVLSIVSVQNSKKSW
jgi:hypothetical protein